jgi:hypothetical protein
MDKRSVVINKKKKPYSGLNITGKDKMNEKVFSVILFCFLIACICAGCATTRPINGGNEELEKLRAGYAELQERYSRLESDYQQIISRQKEFGEQYQQIADNYRQATNGIGSGINELGLVSDAIGGKRDTVERSISEAIVFIQQFLNYYTRAGIGNNGLEGQDRQPE